MSRAGLLRALTLVAGVAAVIAMAGTLVLALPRGPQAGTATPLTALYLDSQVGPLDYTYTHQQLFIEPAAGWTFSTHVNNKNLITVTATSTTDPTEYWSVLLRGPMYDLIAPGTYAAASVRNDGRPYLGLAHGSDWCRDDWMGSFEVQELEMSNPSTVTRLAASFEAFCGGWPGAIFGNVFLNATAADFSAVTITPGSGDYALHGMTQTFTVTNHGTTTQEVSAALSGLYADAFEIASNDCATLAPGETCSVEVTYVSAGTTVRRAELRVTDQTPHGAASATLTGQP